MDVRERDSGETEDRSVNEEKQIDNIIFNLIRRNAKFIDMSNEYQKKIYSQEQIPKVFNYLIHSNYPILYLFGSSFFHIAKLKTLKMKPIHFLFHGCVILSLNQYSKKANIKKYFPEKWKEYEYFARNYKQALDLKLTNFSMVSFLADYFECRITKNKLNNMLSFKSF